MLNEAFLIDVIQRYSFVRFHKVDGNDVEEKLERVMDTIPAASDAIQNAGTLNDGSYGMLVRSDYIHTLAGIMNDTFPGSELDLYYNPLEPSKRDINYWGYVSAKALYIEWFSQRMSTCASEVGQAFYEGVKLFGFQGYSSQELFIDAYQKSADSDDSSISSSNGLSHFASDDMSSISSISMSDNEGDIVDEDDSEVEFDTNIINGRSYSILTSASDRWTNFYPDDEREAERHYLLNRIWSYLMGGRLFLAPIASEEAVVLDVGCGSGAWALEVADSYIHWTVEGYDTSRIIPYEQRENCSLYLDDCNLPILFQNRFDFIHVRGMAGCIDNWPFFIRQCFQALKPGGYLEIKDIHFDPQTYHKPLPESSVLYQWSRLIIENASRCGRDLLAITHVKDIMDSQGFVGTNEVTNLWPLHAQDGKSKRLAAMVRANFEEEIQGLSLGLLAGTIGPEQVELYLAGLRKEVRAGDLQIYWQAVTIYGQKPE